MKYYFLSREKFSPIFTQFPESWFESEDEIDKFFAAIDFPDPETWLHFDSSKKNSANPFFNIFSVQDLQNRTIKYRNFVYEIPSPFEIDWQKTKYESLTWFLAFYSLYWLNGYASFFGDCKEYLKSWLLFYGKTIRKNCKDAPRKIPFFDDHATAMRLETLILLYCGMSSEKMNFPSLFSQIHSDKYLSKQFAFALVSDALLLELCLRSNVYTAHNHAFFHASSLLLFSEVFEKCPLSEEWRLLAIDYLKKLPINLFVDSGLTAEHSSAYHVNNLEISLYMWKMLLARNVLTKEEAVALQNKIELATEASLYLLRPDDSLILMGDSFYGSFYKRKIHNLIKNNFKHSEKPLLKDIVDGKEVILKTRVFGKNEGFAVFYPENASKKYLFVNFTSKNAFHGHFDACNWNFSDDSTNWVIDAGGPFEYASDKRAELISSQMHNIPSINGKSQGSGGCTILKDFIESNDFWSLLLETTTYSPYILKRFFCVWKDLSAIAIMDAVESLESKIDKISIENPILLNEKIDIRFSDKNKILLNSNGGQKILGFYSLNNSNPEFKIKHCTYSPQFQQLVSTLQISYTLNAIHPSNWNGWILSENEKIHTQITKQLNQLLK